MTLAASTSDSAPAWQRAMTEVGTAERMLRGEAPEPNEVARHLRSAWTLLYRTVEHKPTEEIDIEAVAGLALLYHAPTFAGEQAARRLVLTEGVEAEETGASGEATEPLVDPDTLREGLERETAALRQAVDEVASRYDGSVWVAMVLSFLVVVLLALSPLIGDVTGTDQTPWRGRYFDNEEFNGQPREHNERKVEFDWGKERPIRGIEPDHFSIKLDTCLQVDEDTKVRFQLASDDGSRLLVDGEELIDNWGAHGTRTRYGNIDLAPGQHHLMIEYYEVRHGANLTLKAGFDGDAPESIPVDRLTFPVDGDDPCG